MISSIPPRPSFISPAIKNSPLGGTLPALRFSAGQLSMVEEDELYEMVFQNPDYSAVLKEYEQSLSEFNNKSSVARAVLTLVHMKPVKPLPTYEVQIGSPDEKWHDKRLADLIKRKYIIKTKLSPEESPHIPGTVRYSLTPIGEASATLLKERLDCSRRIEAITTEKNRMAKFFNPESDHPIPDTRHNNRFKPPGWQSNN